MFCFILTRSCIRKGRATNQGLCLAAAIKWLFQSTAWWSEFVGSRSCQEPTHNVTVGYPAAYNQETNRNGSIVRSSLHYITIFECVHFETILHLVASPSWNGFLMLSRNSRKSGFASAQDGFIYCLPSHAQQILRVGPGGSELWGPDFGAETWKWTACLLGPEGAIWGIPGISIDPMEKWHVLTDLTLTPLGFVWGIIDFVYFLHYGQVSMVFVRIHDASGSRFSWQWSSGLYLEDPAWHAKQYCNFCFFEILSLDHLQIIVCFRQHAGINEDQSWCRPSPANGTSLRYTHVTHLELYHWVDPPKRK